MLRGLILNNKKSAKKAWSKDLKHKKLIGSYNILVIVHMALISLTAFFFCQSINKIKTITILQNIINNTELKLDSCTENSTKDALWSLFKTV